MPENRQYRQMSLFDLAEETRAESEKNEEKDEKERANGSFARLSESAKYPAHVNATRLSLLPTSYNAEIIAPAFKKFIAVTNVSKDGVSAKGGDMDCKSVLDEANNQQSINEVIDGGYNGFIGFTGKAGYTYEILYTAVDYTGKVVVKKFYVTFNA